VDSLPPSHPRRRGQYLLTKHLLCSHVVNHLSTDGQL
jgi:hypothetical protein